MTTNPPWREVAPEIFDLVDAIEGRSRQAIDPGLLAAVQSAIDSILRPEAPHVGAATITAQPAACVAFAEQFVVDVAGTTDEQRAAMHAATGVDAFVFAQVLYVSDVLLRARIALRRLFDAPDVADVVSPPTGDGADDLWTMLESFMQQVARLDALDPLTAELVRLRGARVHNCRLCQSRLSVRALDAAGDAALFAAIDHHETADLSERHRVALRLTDALVTQPSSIGAALAADVRARFSTEEIVEIVLDVARNAANKIAVALGADAPVVTDGIEYYDIDASGEVFAAADIDAVRVATTR